MDLGRWPQGRIRTRGPPASESRLPRLCGLEKVTFLFLPLFSLLGWGATPVPAEPTPGGWGRERREGERREGERRERGWEGRGQRGGDSCTNSPSLGGGAPLPRPGPWVALCGTRKAGPREGLQRDRETSKGRQVPRAGCASSKERLARVQVLAFLASSGPVRALGSPGSSTAHTQDSL